MDRADTGRNGRKLALETAAQSFAAIGSEPRLDVLLTLVRAGPDGLSVGDIQRRTGIPASTLAHHLKFLVAGGLIRQSRQGRTVINHAEFQHLEALAGFILDECCRDAPSDPSHDDHQTAARREREPVAD